MNSKGGVVLVTGATGFLGATACAELTRCGWRVRQAVRSAADAGGADTVVAGDLRSQKDWSAALHGVTQVVHLAARAHRQKTVQEKERPLYLETNTHATLHLAREAAKAGVSHFVFMSSIGVNGTSTDGRAPFRESDPPAPRTVYAQSKLAAEQGLAAIAKEFPAMGITAIRAPLIYGDGAKGNVALLRRAINLGVPLPFGAIENHRAFVSTTTVADFVGFALERDAKGFDVFIVADTHLSTPEFVKLIAVSRKPRLFGFPVAWLRGALAAVGRKELSESLTGSLMVSTEKAQSIGWKPRG